ncbi:hypothetical protein H4W79_002968 [Nocardiopsis terrae]|uniref:Uncharacterized protein n=1 Tax=Nocardiopsis terrae TaxID=372655 RepID=A0ABR9HIA2_9ACTN|nr:hypothetical protein [Nocardiopsis terrae]
MTNGTGTDHDALRVEADGDVAVLVSRWSRGYPIDCFAT